MIYGKMLLEVPKAIYHLENYSNIRIISGNWNRVNLVTTPIEHPTTINEGQDNNYVRDAENSPL